MKVAPTAIVHATAFVEDGAIIGEASQVWHHAQVRTNARIGARCIVGKGVYIDFDVVIGDDCKLQNYACVYHGVQLGRGVFVGPQAVFTNDRLPRAVSPQFAPLRDGDWEIGATWVDDGASIGANATILPDVRIGTWAVIGAGAVVTSDVAAYAIVAGTPARLLGYACPCGRPVVSASCVKCGPLPDDHPLRRSGPQETR